MKGLITALIIVAVVFSIYQFTVAAYGWFQVSTVVDEIATRELKDIAERASQPRGIFEGDRYAKIREGIIKGAEDAGVDLHPEDVAVTVTTDNVLDVRLSWQAPMLSYQGRTYLQIPMTMQRGFSLVRAR